MKNLNKKLKELKLCKDNLLANTMVNNHWEQKMFYKKLFLIDKEIEKLESPEEYQRNINHWESYENRF